MLSLLFSKPKKIPLAPIFNHFSKKINYGLSSRAKLLKGVNRLADAVQVTLGPSGRNVLIDQEFFSPKITKDGVTVAKAIDLKDKEQNIGAQTVKKVAVKTNKEAGDGTTTAIVLAREIFAEGCKALSGGVNPRELSFGIRYAIDDVIEQIKKQSKPIQSSEEIAQVGTISANGDRSIGELIASAMDKVGKKGIITVQDGKTLHDEIEITEGMKFSEGFFSPNFVTNQKTQTAELEHPYVLIVNSKIIDVNSLLSVLEHVVPTKRPLLVIADDYDTHPLAALIVNKMKGVLPCCAVKSPGFGQARDNNLADISVATGATLISEEQGTKLENADLSYLGSCERVIITKDTTLIVNGEGDKTEIENRIGVLEKELEDAYTIYDSEKLQERLAHLGGSVAVIKVGGASEVEVNEKKDRIDDALHATRAAVDEGILPGGGSSLVHASKKLLERVQYKSNDQKLGVEIIQRVLRKPTHVISENAGMYGPLIVQKILDSDDLNFGYDAREFRFGNLTEFGVIDPMKVVRTALLNSSSVARLLSSTEVTISPSVKVEEQD
ncbi:60 kda heat shock protein [Anaeramoeba flamelloides]|uniref:60 kDa heat shock protein n=1 Tax=Anaeramoeba flamelloides TaxID=1746091 RepID=A0ABQ8YYY1_9EUKA|nr:60 kda heat shock protein [Anaeramoeba flamelloides]